MVEATENPAAANRARTVRLTLYRARKVAPYGVLFAALFVVLFVMSCRTVSGNSDGATIVLEGQAMAQGHVLLHGWTLSLDSFWTIDAIFYMFAVLIGGVHAQLLHIIPALIATLIVLFGILIARDTRKGAAAVAGAITVVVLLGLPTHALAMFYLAGPFHVGTTLWCLIAFFSLRKGEFGWPWIVAFGFLTAGLLGDLQTLTLGVLPIAIAGLVAMLRCWNPRAGLAGVSVAAASVVAALGVREFAKLLGSYSLVSSNPPASWSQMRANVAPGWHFFANLFGVGAGPFGANDTPSLFVVIHVVALVAAVASVLVGLGALVRGALSGIPGTTDGDYGWRIEDVLVLGVFADFVTFCYLAATGSSAEARYLTAGVIFASILTARRVGQLVLYLHARPLVPLLRIAACALALSFCAAEGFALDQVNAPQPAQSLGAFLEAHHLFNGIGGYWNGSITTVETAGVVQIRPVIAGPTTKIVRYQRQSAASWYLDQPFSFLAYNTALPVDGITRRTARLTFGRPTHIYAVGTYRVYTWTHPITESTHGAAS